MKELLSFRVRKEDPYPGRQQIRIKARITDLRGTEDRAGQ